MAVEVEDSEEDVEVVDAEAEEAAGSSLQSHFSACQGPAWTLETQGDLLLFLNKAHNYSRGRISNL